MLVFVVNVVLLFYTWKWFLHNNSTEPLTIDAKLINVGKKLNRMHTTNKHIKKNFQKAITIIFRDFYHFETDLHHSIDSILNLIPNIQILVIYEDEPYPPLSFVCNYTATHSNVKFINLNFDIRKTSKALSPLLLVRTKYVLFVPDSFRFGGRSIIQKMLAEIEKESNTKDVSSSVVTGPSNEIKTNDANIATADQNSDTQNDKTKSTAKLMNKKIVIIPFASNVKTMSNCCRINIDIANWTMEYSVKNDTHHCDMVSSNTNTLLIYYFVVVYFDYTFWQT